MKKVFILFITIFLLFPTIVFAQSKVNVYLFYGEGCPHCEEADNFFKNIDPSTSSKFELKKYEVWYDSDNANMMKIISDMRNDDANGVPYIIIGDESWVGYSDSMDTFLIDKIDLEYNKSDNDRYDVMEEYKLHKDEYKNDDYPYSDVIIEPEPDKPDAVLASTGLILGLALIFGFQVVLGIIILIVFFVNRKK